LLYAPFAADRRRLGERGFGGKVAAIVALGAISIGIFYGVNPATHKFVGDRFSIANIAARSELISMAFTKIANRPLLGYGAGATPDRDPMLGPGVHDTYLQQVVYCGLPLGLLVSLALVGTAAVFLARRRLSATAGVVAYALMVQLVIGLFESSVEGTTLRVLFYLSVGLATALLRAVEAESASVFMLAPGGATARPACPSAVAFARTDGRGDT
jgi:O-antigen ligase